ncbi:MAG: hypothetical protein R3E87_16535 [Burkholderiaceae bacterium]
MFRCPRRHVRGCADAEPLRASRATTMRLAVAVTAVAGALLTGSVTAQEAADRAIAAAVYDLDRIASQLPGLSASRKSSIVRLERSLAMAEQRLAQSSNTDHPSYAAARKRIDDYRAQLQSLTNPPAAAAPPVRPAAAAKPPAPEPGAAPAQARGAARPAGAGNAAGATGARPSTTGAAAASAAAPAPAQMSSHHKVKLSRLKRDFANVQANLDRIEPKSLHFERERNVWRQRLDGLGNNLVQFEPFADDAEVAPLIEQLPKIVAQYDQVEADAIATYEALGDIPAQVAAMEGRYTAEQLPKPLEPPYEPERAKAWAEYIRSFAAAAQKDHDWLTHVRATTDQHGMLTQNALGGLIGGKANRAIKDAVEQTRRKIYEPLGQLEGSSLAFVANLTPADKDKIRNNLLGEGDYDKHMATIRTARQAVDNGRIIDAALGQPPAADGERVLALLDGYERKIAGLYETMLSEVRMPKAASDSTELMKIAADVLSGEKYGYQWQRMVINADKQTRQEDRAWYSGGVVTIAKYDWDNFQVTTAEKVGDQVYLFYNTLRYYRSGASTTPINRWILANRFQSSRILPENIDK